MYVGFAEKKHVIAFWIKAEKGVAAYDNFLNPSTDYKMVEEVSNTNAFYRSEAAMSMIKYWPGLHVTAAFGNESFALEEREAFLKFKQVLPTGNLKDWFAIDNLVDASPWNVATLKAEAATVGQDFTVDGEASVRRFRGPHYSVGSCVGDKMLMAIVEGGAGFCPVETSVQVRILYTHDGNGGTGLFSSQYSLPKQFSVYIQL